MADQQSPRRADITLLQVGGCPWYIGQRRIDGIAVVFVAPRSTGGIANAIPPATKVAAHLVVSDRGIGKISQGEKIAIKCVAPYIRITAVVHVHATTVTDISCT